MSDFPQVPLDLRAELLLAGTWTDVTGYGYQRDQGTPVTITRGRPDEATQASPSSAVFELGNRDSRFSPHNPAGPWYGMIGRNTPVRFSVPGPSARLLLAGDASSLASCGSVPALNVPGDLDVMIDLELASQAPCVLAAKWSDAAGDWSWAWLLNADGTMSLWRSADGATAAAAAVSTQPPPGGRVSLRVQYHSAAGQTSFYWAASLAGPWTQIGPMTPPAAPGPLFAGAAPVQAGYAAYFAGLPGYVPPYPWDVPPGNPWAPSAAAGVLGGVYELRMYAGIGGTLVAGPQFWLQADDVTSFADGQGNTWTVQGTAAVTSRDYRFHGEVSEWPPAWDPTGTDVSVPVTASGLLRRLQQRAPQVPSALTRAWQAMTGPLAPAAYWPCEDASGSAQVASGLPGGTAMAVSGGGTQFAANSDFACASPLAVPGTATWTGRVPRYAPAAVPASAAQFLLSVPAAGDANNAVLLRLHTLGTVAQLDLYYQTGASGSLGLRGYGTAGQPLFDTSGITFGVNGYPCMVHAGLRQSGGGIEWDVGILGLGPIGAEGLSGTIAGTIGAVTALAVAPAAAAVASAIGQIAVLAAYADMTSGQSNPLLGPLNAWDGEAAALRFARLCGENGYQCRVIGPPSQSAQMGPQSPQDLMTLLQECEDADHGMVYEPRDGLALAYRTSASMCAQPAAMAAAPAVISYPAAQLGGRGGMTVGVTDDDQLTLNDEIVTRGSGAVSGSSAETTLTAAAAYAAGPGLSARPPPAGAGTYQDVSTVNCWTDSRLGDHAGWLVHMGTVDEPRYSAVPADLSRPDTAAAAEAMAGLDCGDYLEVTGTPPWLGPDTARAVVWGTTEVAGGYARTLTWMTRPASPYDALLAGDGLAADCRADSAGSTLAAAAGTADTTVQAATPGGGPPWTGAAADLPFDVVVGGERMTVTAVAGAASPQQLTVTRAVNGVAKPHAAGEPVRLFAPCYLAIA